jgi:pimeloyl-ACP methyl ester carboxylesterase
MTHRFRTSDHRCIRVQFRRSCYVTNYRYVTRCEECCSRPRRRWQGVYNTLKKSGFAVTIVQNPTFSLADDVAVTKRALASQNGPVILVGHSYGGVVITEAGNDPKVAGLVYIAAFAPDKGESVAALIKDPPPGAPVPPILPPQDGYLFLDKTKFTASFAADVNPDVAEFMADSQVPWGVETLSGAITNAAWRTKPSWYLVSTEDRMIPPDAQRAMAKRAGSSVVEVNGSHAVYVSQPQAVASLIEKAAKSAAAPQSSSQDWEATTRLAFDAILAPSAATQDQGTDQGADADCLADDEQIVPIAASAPRLDFLCPTSFDVRFRCAFQTEWKTNNANASS